MVFRGERLQFGEKGIFGSEEMQEIEAFINGVVEVMNQIVGRFGDQFLEMSDGGGGC